MNEDRIIKEKFGKDNHFEVPTGYFDNLTSQIMDRLPEHEVRIIKMPARKPLWARSVFRKVAASVAAVIVVSAGVLVGVRHGGARQHVQIAKQAGMHDNNHIEGYSDDETFDQMADYAMMDSQEIYASLIAEN